MIKRRDEGYGRKKKGETKQTCSRTEDLKDRPPPGYYSEWIREQRQFRETLRIRNTVVSKKYLDIKGLEKRRKSIYKLNQDNKQWINKYNSWLLVFRITIDPQSSDLSRNVFPN